ncbi:MAG TPA: hypothetical protein VND43_06670 [Burkholderiales bacterium]|nr:hypothetical protein [Burkholderiales bacterium]
MTMTLVPWHAHEKLQRREKKPAGRRVKIKRVEDMMGISAVSLHIYEGLF